MTNVFPMGPSEEKPTPRHASRRGATIATVVVLGFAVLGFVAVIVVVTLAISGGL